MATTKYIINGGGFVTGLALGGEALPAGFSTVDLKQALGDLMLYTGTHSLYHYRVDGDQLIEQTVQPYAEKNEFGDIVAVHLLGSLEQKDASLVAISEKQYDDLTKDHEDPAEDGLFDPDYGLPRYTFSKSKISKKRSLTNQVAYCDRALSRLNAGVSELIEAQYPAGKEAKLTKGYLEWMAAGQPKKDDREADFKAMQAFIQSVRDLVATNKKKIKKQREKLLKD
ncbi:MAG: hypothetical protein ACFB10_16910 [Salibacteraceae bacterium]